MPSVHSEVSPCACGASTRATAPLLAASTTAQDIIAQAQKTLFKSSQADSTSRRYGGNGNRRLVQAGEAQVTL